MTTEDKIAVSFSALAPLWAPDAWSDQPSRRGWATMRLLFRWRVVRITRRVRPKADGSDGATYVGTEGVSAHWTAGAARRVAAAKTIAALREGATQ